MIIGVGGVDSAERAYSMITAGASLVEAYTGLVFQGPGFCRSVNLGLIKKLDQDGLKNISQAVGIANK